MARKPRDYAAEYRRRVDNARRKAEASGQVFDLSRARGHGNRLQEAHERKARRLARKFSILPSELSPAVKAHGWEAVAERLEAKEQSIKAYQRGEATYGRNEWESADRDEWADIFYWYHSELSGS